MKISIVILAIVLITNILNLVNANNGFKESLLVKYKYPEQRVIPNYNVLHKNNSYVFNGNIWDISNYSNIKNNSFEFINGSVLIKNNGLYNLYINFISIFSNSNHHHNAKYGIYVNYVPIILCPMDSTTYSNNILLTCSNNANLLLRQNDIISIGFTPLYNRRSVAVQVETLYNTWGISEC